MPVAGLRRRLALAGAMLGLFGLAMAIFLLPFAFPTPPPIVTRFQATQIFSPNDDGRRDVATISVTMRVAGEVTLELVSGGRTVHTLRSGPAPAGLVQEVWDGRDADGARVPDDTYGLKLRARSGARQFNTTRRLVIDTTPPRLDAVTVSSAGPGTADGGACRMELTPSDAGRVTLTAAPSARPGDTTAVLGPRPVRAGETVRWRWEGDDEQGAPVPPGLYTLRAALFDAARNLTERAATCWVGHLVGEARAAGPPRTLALDLARPDGTALPPGTPVRVVLHARAGAPGGADGPVLGRRIARPFTGTAAGVRVRLPEGIAPTALWLVAEADGGRALIAPTGAGP